MANLYRNIFIMNLITGGIFMIVIVKKSNIILIALVFLLSIALYSLNTGADSSPVTSPDSSNKTIILDPGHGGEDPGAVSNSGIKEKDVNLSIASKVRDLLKASGYNVIMTREEDKLEYSPETTNITQKRFEDLKRRKKIMDESGASIVVSIHMNKFGQTQYWGAQVFYPPNSPDSLKLAGELQNSIKEKVNTENKRQPELKKEAIVILKDIKIPTVIVECGFLSNPEEEKVIGTPDFQDKMANAIKAGIDKYFSK